MWPDETGSGWDPAMWDAGGMAEPTGASVVGSDVATVTTSSGPLQDNWGQWFQSLGTNVVSYLVQRDAAENGLMPGRAPNGQPVYVQSGSRSIVPGGNGGMLLLLALAVGVAVFVAKKG